VATQKSFTRSFVLQGDSLDFSLDLTKSISIVSQKGVCFMTNLSFIECCHLLAVDPKTLRQWLAQARMSLHIHPTDARIKCLEVEQVNVLARLHGRVLQACQLAPTCASPTPSELQCRVPPAVIPDADLRARLVQMEAQVSMLQAQLTDLALQLLQEREQRTEQRLLKLEAQLSSTREPLLPQSAHSVPLEQAMPALDCHPTEKRNRLIPLIEYGARGQYVLICPKEGELHLTPDSPEWFAWLETLNSFRFLGQQGRLSASRTRGRPCWMAYRRIHGHCYNFGLGNTKRLTIAHLEQMAATLQSHVPSL
jgi:hypothetical protein